MAERFFLTASVGIEQSVFQTIQCKAPVHGAAVYIDVSDFFSQIFGHSAFAARGEPIDCYCYFLHLILIYNTDFRILNQLSRSRYVLVSKLKKSENNPNLSFFNTLIEKSAQIYCIFKISPLYLWQKSF